MKHPLHTLGLALLGASTLLMPFALGCGEIDDAALEERLTGAWYGTGPDGDQCFVFCGDSRVFVGDRPCTDDSGDFDQSLAAVFAQDGFVLADESGTVGSVDMIVFDGDAFDYVADGESYRVSRTSEPGYCADEGR